MKVGLDFGFVVYRSVESAGAALKNKTNHAFLSQLLKYRRGEMAAILFS